jgi:hypothetical protein
MCEHVDGRLVVDLSFDTRTQALTWVLTGTNDDGQVQWLQDGHAPLTDGLVRLLAAWQDAVTDWRVAAVGHGPFD